MAQTGPCVREWYRWTVGSGVAGVTVYAGLVWAQDTPPVTQIIDASRTNILLNIAGIVALAGFCVAVGKVWTRMDQRNRTTEEALERIEQRLEHVATRDELELRQKAADEVHEHISGEISRLRDRVDQIADPPRRRRGQ